MGLRQLQGYGPRHPPSHFVESGAALLLLPGISTPTAAAVVTGFELWLFAMRSGAWTSALLAAMALAIALIGPAVGRWMRGGSGGAVLTFVAPQTADPTLNPADRECMEVLALVWVRVSDAAN